MADAVKETAGFAIQPQWDFMTRVRDAERQREREEVESQQKNTEQVERERYRYERRGGDAIGPSQFRQYADERASEAIERGDELSEQKRESQEVREYARDLEERQVDRWA
ncbi:hypothetical protein GF324_00580 [bacterium]|nr:hypothetical protein [bacterium]